MSYRLGHVKAMNLTVFKNLFAKNIISDELLSRLSLRVPTLTTAQKNALSAQEGVLVYDTDLDDLQVFSNGMFITVSGGSISTNEPAVFGNTSTSTSTNTGSLVVTGGVGIGGDVNIGGGINVNGASTFNDTTQSIDEMSGALVVDGGVGIAKNLNIGGDLNVTGNTTFGGTVGISNLSVSTLDTSGVVNVNDVTQSVDEMSGALVVDGGVGIAKNLNIGENLNVAGNTTMGGTLTITSGSTSGALVVQGGTELQGDLIVNDNITFGGRITGRTRTTNSNTNLDNDFFLTVTSIATVTLPPLSDPAYAGVTYHITKETASTVTIDTAVLADKIINAGSEVNSIDLNGPIYERATLISNGNRWYLM